MPDVAEETPELEALTRNVQMLYGRIVALVLYLPAELELAAANVDDPSALSLPRRLHPAPEDRGAACAAPRAGRRRGAAARALTDPEPRARGLRARHQDPVAGAVGDGEGPARVLPAPADEGDPGGARRGRSRAGGDPRAARARRLRRPAGGDAQGRRPRAGPARAPPGRCGRVRRDPHLHRLDPVAALVTDDGGQPRPPARAPGAGRGPLRPGEGQGTDHRVPRCGEAPRRRLRLDPLLRRPTRRREDRRSASPSHGRWSASSRGSRSAASATNRRSGGTAAPTSAPCRARSSARFATPSRATRSS